MACMSEKRYPWGISMGDFHGDLQMFLFVLTPKGIKRGNFKIMKREISKKTWYLSKAPFLALLMIVIYEGK